MDRDGNDPSEVEPAEVAFFDERHGRDLAVRSAHLLHDRAADASHRDALGNARAGGRGPHVAFHDPAVGPRAGDVLQRHVELLREPAHGGRRANGVGWLGRDDGDERPVALRLGGGGLGGLDRAEQLLALLTDHDEHGTDGRDVALADEHLQHCPAARRGDLHGGLVRLHLDEGLVLAHLLALRDEPARDLCLREALAEIGQPELVRHARRVTRREPRP